MKKHAIIPIFIPHKGCPHDCIFCNQRKITARTDDVTPDDVRGIIDTWLTTLRPDALRAMSARSDGVPGLHDVPAADAATVLSDTGISGGDVRTVEVSFYGGSFTGLPQEEQSAFLEVASEYKKCGLIDKIHMSTRPDYIDRSILDNLRAYGADTIELGVQSFDDEVLRLSGRGHTASRVYEAAELIHEYGFELGIQLMIGLPGDSMESCIMSARETVSLAPSLARLYPTIVLDETGLYDLYIRGEYTPLTREEAVRRTAAIYRILDEAGIYIMRVGLKSTDIIGEGGAINGGTYHPAFRQLVEGEIARENIEHLLQEQLSFMPGIKPEFTLYSNSRWFSSMVGHKACNREYFARAYPDVIFHYAQDNTLADGSFRVSR